MKPFTRYGNPQKRGEWALRWRTYREWHDWILAVVKVVSRQGPMIDESAGDERERETRSKLNHMKAADELFKFSRWRRCKMSEICSEDGTGRGNLQWNYFHSFIIYQFVTKTFVHCIPLISQWWKWIFKCKRRNFQLSSDDDLKFSEKFPPLPCMSSSSAKLKLPPDFSYRLCHLKRICCSWAVY